tara:strand:- start:428 stop:538 length:111 start_codon:yes stop_codon:yes gene_type:complete
MSNELTRLSDRELKDLSKKDLRQYILDLYEWFEVKE